MSDPLLPETQPAHLFERPLDSESVYQGHFLHVKRDQVALPDGTHTVREYVVHPGAVMIIPLLDDGRVVVERQYRYPLHRAMIEFPAGKLEPGEDSWVCAQRELLEETGFAASHWARAGVLHPVISYATEFIDIWFAKGLSRGQRQLDEGEFLDVIEATPQALIQASYEGLLTDAKTLTGLLWLQNVLAGHWPLDWIAKGSSAAGQA